MVCKKISTILLSKRALLLSPALVLLSLWVSAAKQTFSNESLEYKVMFKWGLISKQAGHATLSLNNSGENYLITLTASSEKWADRIYQLRDTLSATVKRDGFVPLKYEKRAHEDEGFSYDLIKYSYDGGNVTADCLRKHRKKKDSAMETVRKTLEATGQALDMVSVFYYMRLLDFPSMKKGDTAQAGMFSGKRLELLTITYQGVETVTYDHLSFDCYRISFKFTSEGQTKSSENIDAWISISDERLPIKVEGQLPVGKIRCLLKTGSD